MTKTLFSLPVFRCGVALWIVICLLTLLRTAGAQELPFFPVWIDNSGELSAEQADAYVEDFARGNPEPAHIVVWLHGFATTREESTEEFHILTDRLKAAFEENGEQVSVVGLQWDSAVRLSLFSIIGEYEGKTKLARKTGRLGARRFLLALQERYPGAKISLLGHSMGCEVAMAAVRPDVDFGKNDRDQAYEPAAPLNIHSAVLLGADLDYDIGSKSRLPLKSHGLKLFWLTQDSLFRPQEQDSVLGLRAILSGKALGASFPLMTQEQYDGLLGHRVAVFDKRAIPHNHSFLRYYDQERINRVTRALLVRAGANVEPPPELLAIDRVIEAPNEAEALKPFLDDPTFSGQVYALWRLETLLGSGSSNFANGHLQSVASAVYHRPKAVFGLRKKSLSPTVRDGMWPTPKGLARSGAPPWANLRGYGWTQHFRGEVVHLEDDVLVMVTTFGDQRAFDLTESTVYTPSPAGLRVGVKVELQAARKEVIELTVIPLHTWLREDYEKEAESGVPSQ